MSGDMTDCPSIGFDSLLDFAHKLADASGDVILRHFRRQSDVENKSGTGGFDPVTVADRAAEKIIRQQLEETYPDHGIVGEEYGRSGEGREYCWYIDPIDGTRAFVAGLPVWGTLIGLTRHERPELGLMNQPFTKERYWSGDSGTYYRGPGGELLIRTRKCNSLDMAVFSTTSPDLFLPGPEYDAFRRLQGRVRMTRYGADCYAYCRLAAGDIDLVAESGLRSHDIIALIPIVERAGGRITSWDGGPASAGGRILASGDPALHDRALKLLAVDD